MECEIHIISELYQINYFLAWACKLIFLLVSIIALQRSVHLYVITDETSNVWNSAVMYNF